MTDYAKREMKALDRIAKKISDAEGHLTKIEDSIDDKKHRTAQHETIKDIKSFNLASLSSNSAKSFFKSLITGSSSSS